MRLALPRVMTYKIRYMVQTLSFYAFSGYIFYLGNIFVSVISHLTRCSYSLITNDKLPFISKVKLFRNDEFNHLTIILILPSHVSPNSPLISWVKHLGLFLKLF